MASRLPALREKEMPEMNRITFSNCIVVFLIFLLLPLFALPANDWGLQLDQGADVHNSPGGNNFSYSGTVIPWLSAPAGPAKAYLSGAFTAEFVNGSFSPIPELLRTEASFPLGEGGEIKAGRMIYNDPAGLVANGLFDGAAFSLDSGLGAFRAGIWYAGLLYKKNAKIAMTDGETDSYDAPLDYSDSARFAATYFAPRRLLFALDWDNAGLSESLRLKAGFVGQADLSGGGELYHSQYLAAKAGILVNDFAFDAGACFELAEIVSGASSQSKAALAGELGAGWLPPTSIKDRLTLTARLSSGSDGALTAFAPITAEEQGGVLKAKLSGLSAIRLDYAARPRESLLFSLASTYFFLSDGVTYKDLPPGSAGRVLGNEFSGSLSWSPFSDLRFNLGGGAFLPSWGNADGAGETRWRVELNAVLTIF
jgi:hypothetical protein